MGFRKYVKLTVDPWIDYLQDRPMGRNPTTLVHILGALHPRSEVPIQQLLRKLQSSPDFKSQGACLGGHRAPSGFWVLWVLGLGFGFYQLMGSVLGFMRLMVRFWVL
jgi:hypothetical protein